LADLGKTEACQLYIAIFVAIAQWYSDNLSEETKKGKVGRKHAGLYDGLLPFGAMRGEGVNAVPLPDVRSLTLAGTDGMARLATRHAGLLQAFAWCADDHSAREIAVKLNSVGYRMQGAWGSNPFTKDTVQRLLGNRFYLDELPDGEGGWVPGKHEPMVPQELWDRAQRARERHRANPQTVPSSARMHVLGGGLLRCGVCWGQGRSAALHVAKSLKRADTAYFACYGHFQGYAWTQPSMPEHVLEAQLAAFFGAFVVPDDLQQRLLELDARDREREIATRIVAGAAAHAQRRAQLEARLERLQQLYELGDWTRDRYLLARQEVLAELAEVDAAELAARPEKHVEAMERLGAYVRAVKAA
jgi:hypothetical protein